MSCTRTHDQYISSSPSTHVRLADNLQCVSKSCPDVNPVLTDTLVLPLLQQCLLSARAVFVNVVNSFIFSVIELRIHYNLKKKEKFLLCYTKSIHTILSSKMIYKIIVNGNSCLQLYKNYYYLLPYVSYMLIYYIF